MNDLRDDTFWDGPTQEPLLPAPGRRMRGRPVTKVERMETRGRARALQALYAADLRDGAQLRRVASTVFDDLAVDSEERQFASRLVATVADRGAELDAALSDVTNNWRLERLGAIERSVLRLAAAEFARGETPVKVVLQEAVHLAERYGTERSARFVNGVLDAYARKLGKL
jgi:transcription antitermination protein NusB